MNCTYVNVFQLYQKCYEYLVVHYIFTVFISIGSQHILHLLLNNSPSLRWTIYTNFLHLKWLYDKIIMKMSQTLWHDFNISNLSLQYLKYLCTSFAKQICKTKPGHYATECFVAFLVLSFNWNYRHYSISAFLIFTSFDLPRFIILSYFSPLL